VSPSDLGAVALGLYTEYIKRARESIVKSQVNIKAALEYHIIDTSRCLTLEKTMLHITKHTIVSRKIW